MHKCEVRSNDRSTGLNCSNCIIVCYSTYYSLFHTPSTISRRLAEVVLRSQWPLSFLPFTTEYLQNRLQWCHSRLSSLTSDWHCMVLSDESHFTLEA
ncbi:hypothetical protein TNCV_1124291 [Trichonephila clavipes]|uniref:Transposase Tc1-like domain-containing protein n=1 Tax=Trichonephila clavipes TaxID=2585209 RepID=A0A8X6SBH8_TRICX|nr:hypothetical protein TNCV_1124291 [Trichonephila clavipes]